MYKYIVYGHHIIDDKYYYFWSKNKKDISFIELVLIFQKFASKKQKMMILEELFRIKIETDIFYFKFSFPNSLDEMHLYLELYSLTQIELDWLSNSMIRFKSIDNK